MISKQDYLKSKMFHTIKDYIQMNLYMELEKE
jgi:hypothetical protein